MGHQNRDGGLERGLWLRALAARTLVQFSIPTAHNILNSSSRVPVLELYFRTFSPLLKSDT